MRNRLEYIGIILINSLPYTAQSNELADRMNHTLPEKSFQTPERADLPTRFRGDSIKLAADLHDRTVTIALNM